MIAKRMILVVEDDPFIRSAISELLRDEGYRVREAEDGQKALESLRGNEAPGLILLDLMMPNVDGYRFREIQMAEKLHLDVPVVVLSAHVSSKSEFDRIQGQSFLRKPFEIEKVLSVIKKHFCAN